MPWTASKPCTVFVTVADLRGFAPAARKLQLSPSAVTRLIAALEEHLGARLLQRTTRQVRLTDVGTRYLERARRILADVEEADGSAREERNRPSGRLVVSAPLGFGRLHVSPVMIDYLKRYPEVTASSALGQPRQSRRGRGRCAVRIGHLAEFLAGRTPGRRDAADHGGDAGLPEAPWRAEDATGIARAPDHRVRPLTPNWHFVQDGRDIEWTPTPRFASNSADAALQYAEAGGGMTRVLAYQAAEGLKRGRLKIVLAKYEQPALPIHIVYPTSRLLSAKVRAFIDLVVETAEWRFG